MRWLPGLRKMRRGSMRPMRRMCDSSVRPMWRMRHSSVQMRCRHCWLCSLWLQLRRRLHALERLGLGQRLLVEAVRHARASLRLSSSGPWGCETRGVMACCDRRRSAAANVLLSGPIAIAARTRTLIS